MNDLEDDDVPQLSSHALAALQEFYAEKNQCGGDKYNVGRIEENWQLSQFWYSQETALRLAKEVTAVAGEGGRCCHGGRGSKTSWSEDVQIYSKAHPDLGK
uniref:EEF1A lysine methyltransferase 1 n=1 Tax=Pipistrellus kuhlii TaxID=59472 RepID=A0A7J7ZH84_PIPKU|nr:EEF1A lysine methyltransferase 1 [Pipistrellus kuhlii]